MQRRSRTPRQYFVYIMSSQTRVLYIGMTNDLERRVAEHKAGATRGFASRYRTRNLVYYEDMDDVWDAIEREKQLKGWTRAKKVSLIEEDNPKWADLSADWAEESAVGM
jgi:putative endonuclease